MIIISGFLLLTGAQTFSRTNYPTTNTQNDTSFNYTVSEPKTITLKITGMSCSGCANNIHHVLSVKNGIIESEVKYPDNVAIIKYDPEKISLEEIIATIEKAGYKAELINEAEKTEMNEKKCDPGCTKSCCAKSK